MKSTQLRDQKLISSWLFLGLVMVFVQILLGGITRLTGSGLSITKWDIVMGSIPPLNKSQWDIAFGLYQQTPQYQHINKGMDLGEFKFIYFWEFFHRLWARTMGFVFIIPFLFFIFRKSFSKQLVGNLFLVIFFASLAAVFGWIMVASGLIERPWVNAYNLTIHLSLGILLFLSLFNAWIKHKGFIKPPTIPGFHSFILIVLVMAAVQIVFGGLVSGMKSALYYPTWPMMNGQWIPSILMDVSHWNIDNFLLYDKSGFMPALALFIHRNVAYMLIVFTVLLAVKWYVNYEKEWRWITFILIGIIVVQISLGILTLVNSTGSIPVIYGSMHQAVGILFITTIFYLHIITKYQRIK